MRLHSIFQRGWTGCTALPAVYANSLRNIFIAVTIRTGAFYIYDDGGNGDTPASDVLQDYIDSGLVVYKDSSATAGDKTQQLNQYTHCLNNYKRFHRWMAFIDVDEFIVLADQNISIPEMMKRYANLPGVGGVLL